ncbi:hypothetical protein ACXX83_06595 [Pseudomonas sp. GNP012]
MKSFDLTDSASILNVLKKLAVTPSPAAWLLRKGLDAVGAAVATPENQAEAAAKVIREGKDAGVDEMEIIMSHEAGLNFKAPIEGVNISVKAGAEGTIKMKVKYK